MPYRQVYEEPPKDMKLAVLKDLPDGVTERKTWFSNLREADGHIDKKWVFYHFCPKCEGWIEGDANKYPVNTLDSRHLAGRQGDEYYCRRCGYQIAFIGLMS